MFSSQNGKPKIRVYSRLSLTLIFVCKGVMEFSNVKFNDKVPWNFIFSLFTAKAVSWDVCILSSKCGSLWKRDGPTQEIALPQSTKAIIITLSILTFTYLTPFCAINLDITFTDLPDLPNLPNLRDLLNLLDLSDLPNLLDLPPWNAWGLSSFPY